MEGLSKIGLDSVQLKHEFSPIVESISSLGSNKITNQCVENVNLNQDSKVGFLGNDDLSWAILQRQRELRFCCAANHNVLRRLVQAARRDMQRQEIQRRLAIADADVSKYICKYVIFYFYLL